jgi:hypothetical protein
MIKFMDEEIKKLLEENLAYSKEVYRLTRKIKNYITFQKIISLIWLILIVAPIILGIIYLPLLKSVFNQYKSLLGDEFGAGPSLESLLKGGMGNFNLNNIDVDRLPDNIKAMLK